MNLPVLSSLLLVFSLGFGVFAEQLYHREGRFIDVAVHKYKTQLPSISDIANSFIHYRVPVAVFVPSVRLNIRSKQKRITYSSFPASTASPKKTDLLAQEAVSDTQVKSNKGEFNYRTLQLITIRLVHLITKQFSWKTIYISFTCV